MYSLLKAPTGVLFCLVVPAYILMSLILLDQLSVIEFSPASIPFVDIVPFLISFSALVLATWQFTVVRKASELREYAIFLFLIVGFNLFQCAFFFLAAAEEVVREIYHYYPSIMRRIFRHFESL